MANRRGKSRSSIRLYFLGHQNHCDSEYSHEIERCLLLGSKAMRNPDSILKSKNITLPTKVHIVKAVVFPVVMYGPESWIIKKVECWRIDAFELWYWRRLLRVLWIARRSNQSILREISYEYSLEEWILNLKLPYFGHLMWRADSLEKTLTLGILTAKGEEGNRRWDGRRASSIQWTLTCANSRGQWGTGRPGML